MPRIKPLFCLRIAGPDDVIAAPTELQAQDAADEFNLLYTEDDMQATADLWPHGAESHAHSIAKHWGEYAPLAKAGGKRRRAGGIA